jgi:hypothetical protein
MPELEVDGVIIATDPTPSSTNIFQVPALFYPPNVARALTHPALPDGVEPEVMEKYGNPFVSEYDLSGGDELHKKACLLCLPEDAEKLSAEEVVEEIIKRVAPEHARDARPTPKKLLSGTGVLRPHTLRRDMARQTEYKESGPTGHEIAEQKLYMKDVPQEQLGFPITPDQARERYDAGLHLTDNTRKVVGFPPNPPE